MKQPGEPGYVDQILTGLINTEAMAREMFKGTNTETNAALGCMMAGANTAVLKALLEHLAAKEGE